MKSPAIPENALRFGLVIVPVGTHTSRTMMRAELSRLIDASVPDAAYADLRRLVIDDNVALKATQSTRRETFRRLSELYGLRPDLVLYRALRVLWPVANDDQPLIALLCALARDPILRATAPAVLMAAEGDIVTPQMLETAVDAVYPARYSRIVLAGIGRHANSSWTQSGHLAGRVNKTRVRVAVGPAAVAYALLLGYLCGERGVVLLDTFWAEILDSTPTALDTLAFTASQRTWLNYRRVGDVAEIDFPFLMRP